MLSIIGSAAIVFKGKFRAQNAEAATIAALSVKLVLFFFITNLIIIIIK
jgi:hypothetical protein